MPESRWTRGDAPNNMVNDSADLSLIPSATDEQTLTEGDQTRADDDQTSSDSDQTSSETDQRAADRDQAASDRDRAAGVASSDYQVTRDIRQRSTQTREETARARLEAAALRDEIARSRDLIAIARDRAAAARHQAMAERDGADEPVGSRADFGVEVLLRAAEQRRRAAEYRALAAEYRAQAAEDRRAAALDREHAAAERRQAAADRRALELELSAVETDPLTGARTRAAGLRDLEHERERCHLTHTPLVVVYVDVVGLDEFKDTLRRATGDELLKHIAQLFASHLRPHDLVIRMGGDEFVCAMSDVLEAFARDRFSAIAAELATARDARGIRTGFATLRGDESAAELIARADADLVRLR